MRVLLVQPAPPASHWPMGSFRSRWVPTGLAYIGRALLRAGHEVRVHVREEHLIKNGFDWRAADAGLMALLEEFRPEVIGFSVLTPGVAETEAIAKLAKETCGRHVLTVAGGVHPSALPERTLQDCPSVDVVAVGEGEATVVELLKNGPRKDVAGLVLREDAGSVRTAGRGLTQDLDALGPPAYELFDMEHYTRPDRWMIRWLKLSATNIRTSRGCTSACRFCAGHLVGHVGVRCHSTEYVVEQVQHAVERYGVQGVHFEDDTLGGDRERLLALCEGLRRRGLHRRVQWDGCLRADQVDAKVLAEMKSAGCIQVEFGFETASDEMLRRLGKGTTAEQNRRAVRLTREAGLRLFADIMVGLPGETEEDFKATVRFLRWARPEVASVSRLCPLPGTAIYNQLPQEVRDSISWGDYSYDEVAERVNLTAMPDGRYREMYREFWKYFVQPKMARDLLRDTPREEREERRRLRKRLARFVMLHPIRAARVGW